MSNVATTTSKGGNRLKKVFGFGSKDPGEALAEKKEAFTRAHTLASERLAVVSRQETVQKIPRANGFVQIAEGILKDTPGEVKKATTVDAVGAQTRRVAEVYTLANQAETAAKPASNLVDFEKSWNSARERLGEMRQLSGAQTDPELMGHIKSASDLLDRTAKNARTPGASKQKVALEMASLSGLKEFESKAKEASKKYLEGKPKNLKEFEQERTKALDKLAETRKLRSDLYVEATLLTADDLIEKATDTARAAAKGQEKLVFDQIKLLGQVDTLVKEAKRGATRAKGTSKTELKAWPKWQQMLLDAKQATEVVRAISTAPEELKEIEALVVKAQLALNEKGAAFALETLSGYPKIVEKAEAKKLQALEVKIPLVVTKASEAVEALLLKHGELSPEYATSDFQRELEQALFLGASNITQASKQLEELATRIQTDIDELAEQKRAAKAKVVEYQKKASEMTKAGYPPSSLEAGDQLMKLAFEADFADRDWLHAEQRLTQAIQTLETVQEKQEQARQTWEAGQKERAEIRQLTGDLLNWPPLVGFAQRVRGSLDEVEGDFQKSGDFVAAVAAYQAANLSAEKKQLEDSRAKEPNLPGESKALREYGRRLEIANNRLVGLHEHATAILKKLEKLLPKLTEPNATRLHEQLDGALDRWLQLRKQPTGQDPLKEVQAYIKEMNAVAEAAQTLIDSPEERVKFEQDAEKRETEKQDARLPEVVGGLLDQLEALDILLPNERNTLKQLTSAQASEARTQDLLKLKGELLDRLAGEKKKEEDRQKQTKVLIERTVKSPLTRIKGRHTKFQDYQEELESQATDLMEMTDSGDPYLIEISRKDALSLMKKVAAVDPEQRGEGATRYKEVEQAWEELGHALQDHELEKYLPETFANLKAELARLIGETRRASPDMGLQLLQSLRQRISRANQRCEGVKSEVKLFKARRERLKTRWAQIKKETRTRVTDRATEFADYLEARLDEANTARKQENGLGQANSILEKLETTLKQIETSPDPREALQKAEGQTAQDQRTVRDLARAFEEELKFFKENTVPEAEKLVKESKGDQNLLDSLKATLKNVSAPVQPYLDMLTLTKKGAAKSPDLSKVKQDFDTARGLLTSAARTVQALKNGGVDSSVDVTKDLKKVQAFYVAQARNYAARARDLAADLAKAAETETDPQAKAAAEKAAKLVESVAGDFRPDAFSRHIRVLAQPASGTDGAQRRAAREKALKTMRHYRKLTREHPVHHVFSKANNPFPSGSAMRAAARAIIIALKRIQLEVLVGV